MERYLIHHNKFFVLEGNCTHSDSESDGLPSEFEEGVTWDNRVSPHFKALLERTVTAQLFDDDPGAPHDKDEARDTQVKPYTGRGVGDPAAGSFDSQASPAVNNSAYNKHKTKKLDDLDDLLEDQ